MILKHYYKFVKTTGKSRFDCKASTVDYPHFENILRNIIKYNVGGLSINLGEVSEHINNSRHRCTQALSRNDHVSKLYLFDNENPRLFYGDPKNTDDALIIFLSDDEIEIFIAPHNRRIQVEICSQVANGSLDDEIDFLRGRAVLHDLPQPKQAK